jgi:membrane protease YdiL (CAAX protease family)
MPPPALDRARLSRSAAVIEELWMRALLPRLIWRALEPVPALIVAALVFAAPPLAQPGRLLAGVTVTVVRARHR